MALRSVRVAGVGCGYWGPNVIRNLDAVDSFELCCICDSDAARLSAVAGRYPRARQTTRVEDILSDAAIDAVYFGTPVSTHFALVKDALEGGKHVLIEKPLAASVEQAQALADLAASRGLTL